MISRLPDVRVSNANYQVWKKGGWGCAPMVAQNKIFVRNRIPACFAANSGRIDREQPCVSVSFLSAC